MKKICYNILIAGGGTGGHLFPGIAIAQSFRKIHPENRILFVGTDRAVEKEIVSRAGFPHRQIRAEGLKGRGRANQIRALGKIPPGIWESLKIMREFRPHLLIGTGGYSSGAPVLAARMTGIKTVLHEQNCRAGIANRVLSFFADRICVSFPLSRQEGFGNTVSGRIRFTGNPVRQEILESREQRKEEGPFTILVIGGSQGAHSINMAMGEAVLCLKNKSGFRFIHQTGVQDEVRVRRAYEAQGISATVRPFFNDMARRYREADLMICRAGATTMAEVTAIGKACVFIPFPYAADDHQTANARALVRAGAADMIADRELNGRTLAEKIEFYASRPAELEKMAASARTFGVSDAAEKIREICYSLLETYENNW